MIDLTSASVWRSVAGGPITDELLDWPPDLFALTDLILEHSEAYRFAPSPPAGAGWPPGWLPGWRRAVGDAGRVWSAWVEDGKGAVPDLLAEEWGVLLEGTETSLERLAEGSEWRLCEAVLTLHAIADEACAGLGVAADASDGRGCIYRARARELLARTGSLARLRSRSIRVLPKVRTPPSGISLRSLSRYACVRVPGLDARWHKVPARPRDHPRARHATFLLLPWPLWVRQTDFRPLEGSVDRLAREPFGLFEFAPAEKLDLDLVDRMLLATIDEVGSVDPVMLPESAVDEREINELEALLDAHGVTALTAGVRSRPEQPGRLSFNWVHTGVSTGEEWWHIRQNKHHRWSLDETQVYQYHLGGALHPHITWWEAMEVPRQSLQYVDIGNGVTVVFLVCEDLARIDDVAELICSAGPTLVITPLPDGPQLTSRWAARYASVLADDPGSAVLTLSSFGMVQRSRPGGRAASPVVALWKDPARGIREIPLEAGAQGVVLTVCVDRAIRRSCDGRLPIENGTELFDVGVHQVRAASVGSGSLDSLAETPARPVLEANELTILTSWTEAAAEALAFAPERIDALLDDARRGAPWRSALGIVELSPQLSDAIEAIGQVVQATRSGDSEPTLEAVLLRVRDGPPGQRGLDGLVCRVLRSALEYRAGRAEEGG